MAAWGPRGHFPAHGPGGRPKIFDAVVALGGAGVAQGAFPGGRETIQCHAAPGSAPQTVYIYMSSWPGMDIQYYFVPLYTTMSFNLGCYPVLRTD